MIILALAAMALQPQSETDAACQRFGDLAESIMVARQAERPMSATLATLPKEPEWLHLLLRDVVDDAYSKQAYYSEDAQQREVARFRNIWERACYSNMAD